MTNRSEPVFYVRFLPATAKPTADPGRQVALMTAHFTKRLDDIDAQILSLRRAQAVGPSEEEAAELGGKLASLVALRVDIAAQRTAVAAQVLASPSDPAIDGEDLNGRVIDLEYEDDEKKTDVLRLTLDNRDLTLFDHPVFEKGARLVVAWGYAHNLCQAREVVVQKVTGSLQLKVEAQDKGVLMHKVPRTRIFEDVSRSAVVRAVAAESGYSGESVHIEETDIVFPVVTQANQTDAAFLKVLADKEGFEFFVDFDGLHWHPRRLGQRPIRELTYYVPPGVGDIVSFELDNDVHGKGHKHQVSGYDPKAKSSFTATADPSSTKRTTVASKAETQAPAPAQTATQIVDPVTLKTTTVYLPATPPQTGAAQGTAAPTTASTQAEAKTQADGAFRRAQQAVVKMNLTLVGDPTLVAKSVVQLAGFGKRLSGRYYVSSAKHSIGSKGYSTVLKVQSDGTGGPGGSQQGVAKPNTQQADKSKGPPAMVPEEVVDPVTLKRTTIYRDTGGRDSSKGGS